MKRCLIIVILCFLNMRFYPCFSFYTNQEHSNNIAYKEMRINHSVPVTIGALGLGETIAGFTLAEVVLVLVIIGSVASFTIPNLIYSVNKAIYAIQLKSTYSDLSQSFNLLKIDNGNSIVPVFGNDTTASYGNGNALNAFLTKLRYIKNCGNGMGCWPNDNRYFLGGAFSVGNFDSQINGLYEKAILANGSTISIGVLSTDCTYNPPGTSGPLANNVCAFVDIDVNGPKGDSVLGRDEFGLWVTQAGIYPYGSYSDGYTCDPNSTTWYTSFGCAYKVLKEGAMNY